MTIPATIHFVWVGDAPMPDAYAQNIVGWARLHPGWWVRVWDDAHLPQLVNDAEYRAAANPAQASDILRYELLFRFGGIYLDCDIEPVKALDPLRDHALWAVREGENLLCPAALGATAGHVVIADVLMALPRAFANGSNNLDQAGPTFVTPILRRWNVTELAQETFYPYLYGEPPAPPTAETFGIHRWAASWVPEAWRAPSA